MPHQKLKKQPGYFSIKKINSVIRFLTLSDILIVGGFGLVLPIFAVYITESINGGTVEVIGIAMTIYLLTKSLGQIPVASIIDKIKGENDDFLVMFIGSIFYALIPLAYIFIKTPLELYVVQFFYGLAAAFVYPSWMAIFTRHIDKEHEGIEWGAYQTMVDLGSAVTASLGGLIAYRFGFNMLFIIVSISIFLGSMFLLGIRKRMV